MLLLSVVASCLFTQRVVAGELSPYGTKHSIGIKAGYHIFQSSDFTDTYNNAARVLGSSFSTSDLNTFVIEGAYDYKFMPNFGIEIALGYSPSSKTYSPVFVLNDSFKVSINNLYFSPSIKGYLPLSNMFSLYAGLS